MEDENGKKSDDSGILRQGIRQIVLSRETIPRTPRWAAAFRRTLLRFSRELAGAEPVEDAARDESNMKGDDVHRER